MPARKLILATRNPDKVRELRMILNHAEWDLKSLLDCPEAMDVNEDGRTLHENALKKAREAFRLTGLPSLADDTGLEVDALNGAPGVHSSRYAGEKATYRDNVAKLLKTLDGVPDPERAARFRCVAAFVDLGREFWTDGVCEGRILQTVRGSQGFGYDPVFFVIEKQKTMAEMSPEEKNTISHRARAFGKMADWLEAQDRT